MLAVALAAAALAQPGRIVFSSGRLPEWGRSRLEQVSPGRRGVRVLAVAPGEGAAFSPDASLVAWPEEDRRTLVLQRTDGGGRRVLGTFPKLVERLTWSPDGSRFAFELTRNGSPAELWVADLPDATPRRLLAAGRDPHWSPGGKRLAVVSSLRLVVVDPASGTQRALGHADGVGAWSPDGSRIAYRADGDLWVVGADGRGRRRVALNAFDPVWSPDGRRLAYLRGRAVHTVDARGGRDAVVARARGAFLGSWTRRGILLETSGPGARLIRLLAGGRLRTLAVEVPATEARDFDGFRFVAERSPADTTEIWSVAPYGSDARPVTHDGVSDDFPALSPDGSLVAYSRPPVGGEPGASQLWLVRSDGGGAHRVLASNSHRYLDLQPS